MLSNCCYISLEVPTNKAKSLSNEFLSLKNTSLELSLDFGGLFLKIICYPNKANLYSESF